MTLEQLAARLPAVRSVLYTLFTEGYLSSHADGAIRRELCDEARRLTEVLAGHPVGATPETFALLALMHLHLARVTARQDETGGLLLLEEQDRSLWDQDEIHRGLSWLARAAEGNVFSRYHAEAGIAAEHCLAPSLAETRWERIVESYALLDRLSPSPVHTLNRAVAIGEWRGPAEGLAEIEGLAPPSWLEGSHLWSAVLADLHARCGHAEVARRYRDAALAAAPSEAIRTALERRLTNGKR
jgi:RNA polymerase sigma-70 factor (ECF subfamily)